MRQLRTLPNYRIPSNSDDDANGMWKMNAVQRARKGGEWPDAFVPHTPANYFIPRATTGGGATVQLTGGISPNTNAYVHSLFPALGAGGTTGSGWSYGGNNCDALSFMTTNNFGYTGTYSVNGIGIGAMNSTTGYVGNTGPLAFQVVAGTNTNGSGLWYWDRPNNWDVEYRGQQATGVDGCQVLELPAQDTYSNYMNLSFGTWYTFLMLWIGAGAVPYNTTQATATYGSSYTQSVPYGSITMNWATPTFSGSGARASTNGTSVTGGQQEIFRILF